MKTKTYKGLLSIHTWGDADDILFLSSIREPMVQRLEYEISGKNVTARYWITNKEVSKSRAQKAFIDTLMGVADCELRSHYSEITGYLWTDENVNIGGHDLIKELRSYVGKWLILEVDIHEDAVK